MADPWKRYYTFVELRMIPIGAPSDLSKFQLVNDARNGALLGVLELTHEERQYLVDRIVPTQDNVQYQSFIFARLTNPASYSVNGRKLSTYSISEQLNQLNVIWGSSKSLPPDA